MGKRLNFWDESNIGVLGSTLLFLEGSRPLGRDAAWLLGFVIAMVREPWIQLGVMSVVTRGLAPPVERGGAWLISAIKELEPKLTISPRQTPPGNVRLSAGLPTGGRGAAEHESMRRMGQEYALFNWI